MKKVTIVLPRDYNNGKLIPASVINDCLYKIRKLSGGYTKFDAIGTYEKNEEIYHDRNIVIMTVVHDLVVDVLRILTSDFCKILEQECIYFEVSDCDVDFVC